MLDIRTYGIYSRIQLIFMLGFLTGSEQLSKGSTSIIKADYLLAW